MTAIEERVTRGAEFLDTNYPGWERVIDVGALDLEDTTQCVLGQIGRHIGVSMGCHVNDDGVVGDDHDAMSGFTLMALQHGHFGDETFGAYGFDLAVSDYGRSVFANLDDAWISLIKERFASGTLSDEAAA